MNRNPLPHFTLDRHTTAMLLHDVLHNTQTKAGAATLTRPALIDTIKALEDMRRILLWNPGSWAKDWVMLIMAALVWL